MKLKQESFFCSLSIYFCKWNTKSIKVLTGFLFLTHYTTYAQDLSQMKKSKPFTFSGALSVGSGMNLSSAGTNPYNQYAYNLNFSPLIKIYNVSLPFTFYITNNSKGFNHPFNRVGVSPTWKWLKFHAGYRTLNVSPYIFSGRMVLGGGVEMNPGKFRFAFMGGQLSKSQSEDTLSIQPIATAYERYGFGGKIGFGSTRSYFDLLFFKGKDVAQSITEPVKARITPAENAAAGISFSIAFSKRLVWQTSAVLSVYTRDVNATGYGDAFSEYTNTPVIGLNLSSQYLPAGETSLRYTGNKGSVIVKYRRIDPEFKTMGIFYMQTDLSEYSILFNQSLFKSKLSLNGNVLYSTDNVYRVRNTLTSRLNCGLNSNYRAGKSWLLSTSVLYTHMEQSFIRENIGDSLRMDLLNKMASVGVTYTKDRSLATHVTSLMGSYNSFDNINPHYLYDISSANMNGTLSHKITIKKNKLNFTEQVVMYSNKYGAYYTKSVSVGESVGKSFFKEQFNANVSVNYIYSILNANTNKSSVNCRFGISYKPNKNNTFGLNGSIQNNIAMGNSVWFSSFNIRYTLNFNEIVSSKTADKPNDVK